MNAVAIRQLERAAAALHAGLEARQHAPAYGDNAMEHMRADATVMGEAHYALGCVEEALKLLRSRAA